MSKEKKKMKISEISKLFEQGLKYCLDSKNYFDDCDNCPLNNADYQSIQETLCEAIYNLYYFHEYYIEDDLPKEIHLKIPDNADKQRIEDFIKELKENPYQGIVQPVSSMEIMELDQSEIEIAVELVDENSRLPQYANPQDAGMDVYAREDVEINCEETVIIPIGIKVAIPQGYEIQVRARSGVSLKTPLRISNGIGTIDSMYKDEIGVIITNTSSLNYSNENEFYALFSKGNKKGKYLIKKGDRIAQLVLQKVPQIKWKKVDSIKDIGTNRGGGFGSSGVNNKDKL